MVSLGLFTRILGDVVLDRGLINHHHFALKLVNRVLLCLHANVFLWDMHVEQHCVGVFTAHGGGASLLLHGLEVLADLAGQTALVFHLKFFS